MTMLYRMRFKAIAPFLSSLKQSGYAGDVAAFVTMMDDETIAEMNRHGIITLPFRFQPRIARRIVWFAPVWRHIFKSSLSQEKKERLAHAVFPLFYRRHLLYLQFLREHRQKYSHVFITDCRDVFFQANPFSVGLPPGVHFFLEEAAAKIGYSPDHVRWLMSQFGRPVLDELANKTVSCAGTTFGDIESMIGYLSTMVSLSMSVRSLREHDGDQGIHNYILRKQLLPNAIIHENRRGPVMTMGMMVPGDIHFNPEGWIINDNGGIPPILHQYDRIKQAEKTLLSHLKERKFDCQFES